jgi:hypothetical protein
MDTRRRGRKTKPIIAPFHSNRRASRLLNGGVGIPIRNTGSSPVLDAWIWLVDVIAVHANDPVVGDVSTTTYLEIPSMPLNTVPFIDMPVSPT